MFPALSNVVDADLMLERYRRSSRQYQGHEPLYQFHASQSVINKNEHPKGEMFALKAIKELIAKYLANCNKDGSNKEARETWRLKQLSAGYYIIGTSAHTIGACHGQRIFEDLVHGAEA